MDYNWLQHVGNPYSVIALIAVVLGSSIHLYVPEISKKRPAFLKASYILFIFAALSLIASVVAVSFLLSGVGAKDMQAQHTIYKFIETAQAHEYDGETIGWIWFGQEGDNETLNTQTVSPALYPKQGDEYATIRDIHLRNRAPKFSWWRFRYVLGKSIMELHEGEQIQVLNTYKVGEQLWCVVLVIPE